MQYSYEELKRCKITRRIILKWFVEANNYNKVDVEDLKVELKVNGDVIADPLAYYKEVEEFLNENIDKHCKILLDMEAEIEKRANKKAKELLENKVYELQQNISGWLDENE